MAKEITVHTADEATGSLSSENNRQAFQKLMDAWRSKNAESARRVGTFSFMAATLTACVDGSGSNSSTAEEETPFSVDTSDPGKAAVSGEFVFITTQENTVVSSTELKSASNPAVFSSSNSVAILTPASIVDGSQALGLVDYQFDLGAGKSIDGASALILADGVTVVGKIAEFDLNAAGVKASGDGNVWLLIGKEGAPSAEHRALLDIRLDGGDLTFDMPSDDDVLTLEAGTVIDLGGGTLIVSDGKVMANAADVKLLNIGDIIVNSELVITYDQFMEKSEDPDFTVTGTGVVTVLVEDDVQAASFFDAVAKNPAVLGENAPDVRLENTSLGVATEVDLANLVDSKLVFLSSSLEKQIANLDADLQGQIDLNVSKIGEVASDLTALQGVVTTLQGTVADNKSELQGNIEAVQDNLDTAIGNLTSTLNGEVSRLEGVIASGDQSNAQAIAGVADDLSALQGVVTTLQGTVADNKTELKGNIDQVQDNLDEAIGNLTSTLNGEVSRLEGLIASGDQSNAQAIAGVADDLSALQGVVTTLQGTVADNKTELQGNIDQVQGNLDKAIGSLTSTLNGEVSRLESAIASGDQSNAQAIAGVADDLSALQGVVTTLQGTVADNKSELQGKIDGVQGNLDTAIGNLSNMISTAISDLEVNLQGDDFDAETDLSTFKAISDAIALLNADDATEGSVAFDLKAQFETLTTNYTGAISTAIDNLEQKLLGDDFDPDQDYATLESLSDAVDGLVALADGDFSGLLAKVGNPAEDGNLASGLYAKIESLQSQIDNIVKPDLIQRNELDNRVELDEYESSAIRVELGEGNDFLNSSDAETEIVGGRGADTINLTYNDTSKDTVVYQTVEDGRVLPTTTVSYSADPSDYREGSQLNITINGKEYSYTVRSDDGDTTIDSALIDSVLGQFSQYLSFRTVQDPANTLVGFTGSSYAIGEGGMNGIVTRADLDDDGAYTVPAGKIFVSANDLLAYQIGNSDTDSDISDYLGLLSVIKSGGERIYTDQAPVFNLSGLRAPFEGPEESSTPLFGEVLGSDVGLAELSQVSLSQELVEEILSLAYLGYELGVGPIADTPSDPTQDQLSEARAFAADYASELLVGDGGALSGVSVEGNLLTFYGQAGEPLKVEAGGDNKAAIVNNGLVTRVDISFSDQVDDWPTPTNGDNTTVFDRQLRVTIDGEEVVADVVYASDGKPDPAESVKALAKNIDLAAGQGGVLEGVIPDTTVIGTKLTLIGAKIPETDAGAPTFKVDSAAIDQNGVQQETKVSFSTNDADYYVGGTLSVEIAGQTVTADMVAGDAAASVAALKAKIDEAVSGVRVGTWDYGDTNLYGGNPLKVQFDETTALATDDTNHPAGARYSVNIKIGDLEYTKSIGFDSTEGATTVGGVVDELNDYFDGVAVFAIDSVNQSITVTDSGTGLFVNVGGTNPANLVLSLAEQAMSQNSLVSASTDSVPPTLAGVLESVEQADIPSEEATTPHTNVSWGNYVGKLSFNFSDEYSSGGITVSKAGELRYYSASSQNDPKTWTTWSLSGLVGQKFESTATLEKALNDAKTQAGDYDWQLSVALVDGNIEITAADPTGTPPANRNFFFDDGDEPTLQVHQPIAELTITAATEEPDPLQVTAELSYEGEYQQATFVLEDVAQYAAFSDGTPLDTPDRGADVYFEGGQAHVTITGAGADGDLGTGDDVSATISVDMQSAIAPTIYYVPVQGDAGFTLSDPFTDGDGISFTVDGASYAVTDETDTLSSVIESLNNLSVVKSATIVDSGPRAGQLEIVFFEGAKVTKADSGFSYDATGDNSPVWEFASLDDSLIKGIGAAELTPQALVDAINDKIDGVPSTETPALIRIEGNFSADTKIADSVSTLGAELFFGYSGMFDGSGVSGNLSMKGVSGDTGTYYLQNTQTNSLFGSFSDNAVLSDLLEYIGNLPEFASAVIDDGDIVITSAGTGADTDLSVTLTINTTDFEAATTTGEDIKVTGEAQGAGDAEIPADPTLSALLENAELGEDGTITLTAKEAGKETFEISDVTLDYQGVKQLTTFSLDGASEYSGLSDGSSTNRGADVYFEGGKAYITIREGLDTLEGDGIPRESTVSVDMAGIQLAEPVVLTLSASDGSDLSLDMKTTNENLVYTAFSSNSLDRASIIPDSENVAGDTLKSYLDKVAELELIESYKLVEGSVELTVNSEVLRQKAAFEPVLFSHYGNGGTDGSIEFGDKLLQLSFGNTTTSLDGTSNGVPAIPAPDPAAATSQALVDELNEQISGTEPDALLSSLLESAAYDPSTGEITLTSKGTGKDLFQIADVSLDYQGVKQISTAALSTDDSDYYVGGEVRLTVDTTPQENGDDVGIVAEMADTASGTFKNLLAELQKAIDPAVQAKAARVEIGESLDGSTAIAGNPGENVELEFKVEDGVTSTTFVATALYSQTEPNELNEIPVETIVKFSFQRNSDAAVELFINPDSVSVSAFVNFITKQLDAQDGVAVSLESGSIVVKSTETGADQKVSVSLTDVFQLLGLGSTSIEDQATGGDAGSGALNGIVGSASIDQQGVLTLTSQETEREAFLISDAELTVEPVKQLATVDFSVDDADYLDGGSIGLTVNDEQVSVETASQGAAATLEALESAIQSKIDDGTLTKVESVALNKQTGTLTLTAKDFADGYGEIDISEVFTDRPAQVQVTELDLSGVDFEDARLSSDGELPQVSVTVAGHTITAEAGADDAATIDNLVQAIVEARDGVRLGATVTSQQSEGSLLLSASTELTSETLLSPDPVKGELGVFAFGVDQVVPFNFIHDGATVGDFVAYINNSEGGLAAFQAEIRSGDIVISNSPGNPVSGDVTFNILAGDFTEEPVAALADSASGSDESPASLTLESFAGLSAGASLAPATYSLPLILGSGSASPVEYIANDASTLNDFIDVINNTAGVSATLTADGIVITADDATSTLATGAFSITVGGTSISQAAIETVSGSDATAASVVLEEFAGARGDQLVKAGDFTVDYTLNGATQASQAVVSVTEGDTLDQVVADLNSQLTGVTASLTTEGLVLSTSADGATASLSMENMSLTLLASPVTAVAEALGSVEYEADTGLLTLTARKAGSDPIEVQGVSHEVEEPASSVAQEAGIFFYGDATMDGLAEGSEVRVTLAGSELVYKVSAADVGAENPSLSIAEGVFDLLVNDSRGLVDGDKSTFSDVDLSTSSASELTIVASLTGPDVLGNVDNGEFGVSVFRNTGTASEPVLQQATVAAVSENKSGVLNFTAENGGTVRDDTGEGGAQTGLDAGRLTYDGTNFTYTVDGQDVLDQLATAPDTSLLDLNDQAQEGVAENTTEDQTVENPSDNGNFYGDKASEGQGNGAAQTYTNPENGFDSRQDGTLDLDGTALDTGGNVDFAGDAERTGSEGVSQSHTNSDSGYDALDQSPAENTNNANVGDETLYGSDPGQYVEDGLETEFLAGGTDAAGDGVYENRNGEDLSGKVGTGDGSEIGDGGVAGKSAGEFADGVTDDDDFAVTVDDKGFAAFDWDEATVTVVDEGNAAPDLVRHFQTSNDVIGLEGELAASTRSGDLQSVAAPEFSFVRVAKIPTGNSMSLSDHEFGLVSSDANANSFHSVTSAELADATAVATLLEGVYDFSNESDSGEINTTLFAVTASDDDDLTAIWVHTQSSGEDNTVDALELSLLALVETEGDKSFSEQNFAIEIDGSWQQPDPLQPFYV